ncbi:centrosomal protein of 70 kDa [Polymixia lowei]
MEQQEQTEWDCVNKLLQNHGFKPVYFADPVENKNLSDLVLLDKKAAGEIRTTLGTMLSDSERRQALIQELIQSNNQLKEEAQELMGQAARQSQRATELEGVLDGVKGKVQDLEDRYLGKAVQQHGRVDQLQQEKQEAQRRCQALEQKLSKERETVAQLQRKLYFTVKEEERRAARQTQAFQQICKRSARLHSPADQQVLDVIDFYETRSIQTHDEARSFKGDSEGSQASDQSSGKKASGEVTPSFKTLLKSYQEELKESRGQREQLRSEVQRLKQELETRPTVKELKYYKHQLRRMDKLINQNNTRLPKDDNTAINNIEAGIIGKQVTEAGLCAQYRHLLNEIRAILTNPKAPLQLNRQKPPCRDSQLTEFQGLLPTLETWAEQLNLLKDLHRALTKLSQRLMPWQPSNGGQGPAEAVSVEDVMLLVDTLLEDTSAEDEKVLRSPTRYTLESMVSHFQKLFDVRSLSGVYPRMNQVYTRVGEMTNALRNLRDILNLDDRAPPSEVVNRVSRMVSSAEDTAGSQLHGLLGEGDLDSIILKVKEHEEFFPAFHSLVMDLLQTLGVSCLDDIVPALRSLKLRAQ